MGANYFLVVPFFLSFLGNALMSWFLRELSEVIAD